MTKHVIVAPLYTAQVTSIGGRGGHITSSDKVLDMDVRVPKSMGGPGGEATNPEQLFAAGYSACFNGALGLVMHGAQVKAGIPTVEAHVTFGKTEDGGFAIAAELHVNIPGVAQNLAEELVAKAHTVCPYSKAVSGNIDVKLVVTANEAATA